jgi:succinyl-CoA synthetase alpha subunit
MVRTGVGDFKYYVGIASLGRIATRDDRVCVLNILGGESSEVTPTSHAYSGGNVAFGTSPGRRGQVLATPAGDIPVYNNVCEGLEDGHRFNCGVVYLPPSAARDGVAELIRVNPELTKIFIVTEKIAVRDAREIRAMGQAKGIDIFGANGLGVADAWHEVRIGGALGGDSPRDALRRGSIAVFSNSGGFTTTIAQYLRMAGWGTSTLISSGKDVYIHYAAPEFAFALGNDERTRAAVLYCEPGGYYEQDAHFTKPVVACVVGRWKSRLTRAVGHAGAMAGGSDDAAAKERWFLQKFGVDAPFTAERPVHSARGALVTNIALIPQALTAVMRANGVSPDFEPEGNLALKPWFGASHGLPLPAALDLPAVRAPSPYAGQIAALESQIGAVFPRQTMKDASGASRMDASTQITSLHSVSMLEAARLPLQAHACLALLREPGSEREHHLIDVAVGAELCLAGSALLAAAQAARDAGGSPATVLAAASCLVGPAWVDRARRATRLLIERFTRAGMPAVGVDQFDLGRVALDDDLRGLLLGNAPDSKAEAMLAGLRSRRVSSPFIDLLHRLDGPATADAVLAAVAASLAWSPLQRKRISLVTATNLPWWLRLFGSLIGASVSAARNERDRFCGIARDELLAARSLTDVVCHALLGRTPTEDDRFALQTLVGLLLSNGPGTISAQGAKGAVAADGPQAPERVQLQKALAGALTHTGFAHGGNGYEGVAFLIEQFRDSGLVDPGRPDPSIDVATMARSTAERYASTKRSQRAAGDLALAKLPGVNHPVFKDRPVNHDPREVFVRELLARRGEHNIFIDYYHALVQALADVGVARKVYCVNIDAVIAALLLKVLWQPLRRGELSEAELECAAFTVFLVGRMFGSAAEVEDHLNRGLDMDTRTPVSQCQFVA